MHVISVTAKEASASMIGNEAIHDIDLDRKTDDTDNYHSRNCSVFIRAKLIPSTAIVKRLVFYGAGRKRNSICTVFRADQHVAAGIKAGSPIIVILIGSFNIDLFGLGGFQPTDRTALYGG